MTTIQLLEYLRRDLTYFEGVADVLDCIQMKEKVNSIRHTLNEFEKDDPVLGDRRAEVEAARKAARMPNQE